MTETAMRRPGWPEIALALAIYLVLIGMLGVWMLQTPSDQAAMRGIVGMAANGVAGTLALLAAVALRIRDFRAFGFRPVSLNWLLGSVALGVAAFASSFLVEYVYFLFITEPNTQVDFQAAAKAGVLPLLALLISGALLTPLGEEFVFRGVVANVLNRYGAWAGVVGSALIFGAAHGPSVIFVLAFLIGIVTGILFRRTESIWPGVMLQVVYNGLHLLYYAML